MSDTPMLTEQVILNLQAELSAARAEIAALKTLFGLPDDYCLSCGGVGGHDEGCRGTTPLLALQAEIERLREDAERYRTQRDIAYQGLLESCPDECHPICYADFNATYDAAIDKARRA